MKKSAAHPLAVLALVAGILGGVATLSSSSHGAAAQSCDPNYLPCIPPPPPDLDCGDLRIGVRVIGDDPHGLDRDGDGVGCESYGKAPPAPKSTSTTVAKPQVGDRFCDGELATIVGTAKSDVLRGTNGADVIVALGGNDKIIAKGGDDVICAGPGNDVVGAGAGNDRVFGEAGKDKLKGQNGDDVLSGGVGNDKLIGGRGNDSLNGGRNRDVCKGQAGRDTARKCEKTSKL